MEREAVRDGCLQVDRNSDGERHLPAVLACIRAEPSRCAGRGSRAGGGSHRLHRRSPVRLAFGTCAACGGRGGRSGCTPRSWWRCRASSCSSGGSCTGRCRGTTSAGCTASSGRSLPRTPSGCGGGSCTRTRPSQLGGVPAHLVQPGRQHGDGGNGVAPAADDSLFDPYDESEPELAAYNRYLAGLHAADRRKRP